jgi:uncharacterized protein
MAIYFQYKTYNLQQIKQMKPWSFYNTMFHSEKSGFFLYNALSGFMLELDKEHYQTAARLRDGLESFEPQKDSEFPAFLEEQGFLAQREDELLQLMQLQYDRNAACFNTSTLGLTICPTMFCNFNCSYCIEENRNDGRVMSEETIDALVSFIKKHKDARKLTVLWYGGEPTLSLDVVKKLTSLFLELYPGYANAGMVTNGYLLDGKWIDELGKLKITHIQITLDGPMHTHDSRRMLKGGGPTYSTIMDNIDLLMNSSWQGRLSVRVNVDRTNSDEFASIRKELLYRHSGKKISVYPGRVNGYPGHSYDHRIGLCTKDWTDFLLEGYKSNGLVPRGGFFPTSGASNLCIATSRYGYVIGPEGEIYKCFEDAGNDKMAVGSIHDPEPVSNRALVVRYSTGADPFNDKDCVNCPVLPVCGGGCACKRLHSKYSGQEGSEYCSLLRDSLVPVLEAYLDTRQTMEICNALLGNASGPDMHKGYRLIQPERKSGTDMKNPLEFLQEQ